MKQVALTLLGALLMVGCEMPSQFEGTVQIKHQGVLQAEGQYESGVKTGVWTFYDAEGNVKGQGTYKDGKMVNGLEVDYYDNGQKASEGTWANGQKDGYWILYYRNGNKHREGTYSHGTETGVWREYDPSNYYITEKVYENGEVVGWRNFTRGRLGNPLGN